MNSNNEININDYTFSKKISDKYVYIIAFFIGIVIITIGAYFFIGPFLFITNAFKVSDVNELAAKLTNLFVEYQGVLLLLADMLGIVLAVAFLGKLFINDAKDFKTNWKRCLICMGCGILAIYLFGELFEFIQIKLGIEGSSENQEILEMALNGKGKLAMILSICIAAPIFEELVFRKFIYGYLSRTKLHIILNIAIVAFIFAMIHCLSENFLTFTAYFFLANYLVLSLSLTLPYVLSKGNIYVSIAVHMFNNILSLLYFYGVLSVIL